MELSKEEQECLCLFKDSIESLALLHDACKELDYYEQKNDLDDMHRNLKRSLDELLEELGSKMLKKELGLEK